MPDIHHTALNQYLAKLTPGEIPPVWLIYGEDALYEKAAASVIRHLIPDERSRSNCESADDDSIQTVIERMKTFSLLGDGNVIRLNDSRIFYAKRNDDRILKKVKETAETGKMKKAGKRFMAYLSTLNLTLKEVDAPEKRVSHLNISEDEAGNDGWAGKVTAYCIENDVTMPASGDPSAALAEAVESGFPKGNILIITTDYVDKRKRLHRVISENGLIIDCSVPKGGGRQNEMNRRAVLEQQAQTILQKSGKQLLPAAFELMSEMTGFDIRTFSGHLEKLVQYVGGRPRITPEDVSSLLRRTRKDPIYELTNAAGDRNLPQSLVYLKRLTDDGMHPLQILSALVTQIRKLLIAKDFVNSQWGKEWRPGMNYQAFQKTVLPSMKAYEEDFAAQISRWGTSGSDHPASSAEKSKKKSPVSDLWVAHKSKSPYPVYLLLKKTRAFGLDELQYIMMQAGKADLQLKSSRLSSMHILETLIRTICRPPGFHR